MIIKLSPQRRDDILSISRLGDILTINGMEYDFTLLGEGGLLPRDAVDCPFLISDVERVNGAIVLSFILPHGPNASVAARFPGDIIDPPNGTVVLPS